MNGLKAINSKIEEIFSGIMTKEAIEDYTVLNFLGKGAFGSVMIVKNNKTSEIYSMRALNKKEMSIIGDKLFIKGDRPIIELINFPGVVSLDIAFQSKFKLYLLGKYSEKKELYDYIDSLKSMESNSREKIVKGIAKQLLLTLKVLHEKGLIYKQ